jgi:hypothetical protein
MEASKTVGARKAAEGPKAVEPVRENTVRAYDLIAIGCTIIESPTPYYLMA